MRYKPLIITVIAITVILLLNHAGILSVINPPINQIIAGSPDTSCSVDSDCVIRDTRCAACDCGIPVNINWQQVCPFKIPFWVYQCKPCPSLGYDFNLSCIENQCRQVWSNGQIT